MNITRKAYLEKIRPFIDTPVVKVITGIRRSGKSVLLDQVRDLVIEKGASREQTLSLNFESFTDERVRSLENVVAAVDAVQKKVKRKKIYLFLDEIQELSGWEKLVNSILVDFNADVYITGSNAKLLSGELSTYLAGRYVEIKMYPFGFKECYEALCKLKRKMTPEKAFGFYIETGGFPFLYNFDLNEAQRKQYLDDIFNSIILKDITDRYKVRDISLLRLLIVYFIENIGNTFSAQNLVKFLKNEKRSIAPETIYNYLEYAREACLLHLVPRQDLVGKEVLATQEKIYIIDHGIRQSLFLKNQKDIGQVLENIVYIELLRRGYTVTVGRTSKQEIDFCAQNDKGKEYFQVCYLLATEETVQREFGAFASVRDNFPKYVLSLDGFDFSRNGIIHRNLIRWLLE